jgi:hypothetical protein
MALTADGWRMGSHVAALGLTVFAYRYARKQSGNRRFTFGSDMGCGLPRQRTVAIIPPFFPVAPPTFGVKQE